MLWTSDQSSESTTEMPTRLRGTPRQSFQVLAKSYCWGQLCKSLAFSLHTAASASHRFYSRRKSPLDIATTEQCEPDITLQCATINTGTWLPIWYHPIAHDKCQIDTLSPASRIATWTVRSFRKNSKLRKGLCKTMDTSTCHLLT